MHSAKWLLPDFASVARLDRSHGCYHIFNSNSLKKSHHSPGASHLFLIRKLQSSQNQASCHTCRMFSSVYRLYYRFTVCRGDAGAAQRGDPDLVMADSHHVLLGAGMSPSLVLLSPCQRLCCHVSGGSTSGRLRLSGQDGAPIGGGGICGGTASYHSCELC